MSKFSRQQTVVIAGLAGIAAASVFLYWFMANNKTTKAGERKADPPPPGKPTAKAPTTSRSAPATSTNKESDKEKKQTDTSQQEEKKDEKVLHVEIEELDKKGKALFKNKKHLAAAEVFSEALDLIENFGNDNTSSTLLRQKITLMNNRSAMYEKGGMAELALEDCSSILELEVSHTKARTRKLRILESLKRYDEALVEICALQLLFMQSNRTNLRMGLPVPQPPVSQARMEEVMTYILPVEIEKYVTGMKEQKERPMPSTYTILQLLKSYTGYNAWMAEAAKFGSVEKLTKDLTEVESNGDVAKQVGILLKRGQRYMYDRDFEHAAEDFDKSYQLVDGKPDVQSELQEKEFERLLEWTGMSRHFHYDLDTAISLYQKCIELEPENPLILVKQAGVHMDAGKHEEALQLFDKALQLDPQAADALLHRSNLRMLQQKPEEARKDLEKLLKHRPSHTMARLRLAAILAATNDISGAKKQLDFAEKNEPNSSEVLSYRGELSFTQGDMEEARRQFEKAIELEPTNPTPYVNAAMALLNTPPPPGQAPDAQAIMTLLEQAIEVDPQFTAAYIQLGQLKLGTATDLVTARQVVTIYDQGLANCRSPEEVKELCSIRVLAVAQVEAAQMLNMETFDMQ